MSSFESYYFEDNMTCAFGSNMINLYETQQEMNAINLGCSYAGEYCGCTIIDSNFAGLSGY